MTYCVAINVEAGLVFASDSRTNAGPDQVSTYSKMHRYALPDRNIVLLSAGNLGTTQAVVSNLVRMSEAAPPAGPLAGGEHGPGTLGEVAEALGTALREQGSRHGEIVSAGVSMDATFIIGGQIGTQPPAIYLVYPQGNYITTSERTRHLQVGEIKYGKPVLDRVLGPDISLDAAALCALVSMDSTMRSNATVGPPIELLVYPRDSHSFDRYIHLEEDDPYLLGLRRAWNERLMEAFDKLPPVSWPDPPR